MSGPSLQDIQECVYGVASGETGYSDVVGMIAQRYPDARIALLSAQGQSHSQIIEQAQAGYDQAYAQTYYDYYQYINIWTKTHFQFSTLPQIISTRDAPALPVQKMLYKSEFYNDWVKPQDDISEGIGVLLGGTESSRIALTLNVPSKSAEELLPHIAFDLGNLLQPLTFAMRTRLLMGDVEMERTNFETALGMLSTAACVLSAHGKVIFANPPALDLFSADGDIQLKASGDLRFAVAGSAQVSTLSELLTGGLAMAGKVFMLERSEGRRPLVCTLTPLSGYSASLGLQQPRFMLIITDPVARNIMPTPELVGKYLNLSPAESRVAIALAGGGRIAEIAKRLQLSPNTVRNQISAVLNKTGCGKQGDVATIIMALGRVASPPATGFADRPTRRKAK